jgi:hypothetical protein
MFAVTYLEVKEKIEDFIVGRCVIYIAMSNSGQVNGLYQMYELLRHRIQWKLK